MNRTGATMTNVQVGSLGVRATAAPGHEHRMGTIAAQATSLFAHRLDTRLRQHAGTLPSLRIDTLNAAPTRLELARMTDAEAAGAIADAWLGAIAARLRVRW
jgi:hypothetical protein